MSILVPQTTAAATLLDTLPTTNSQVNTSQVTTPAKSNAAAPSAVPQDTVTISAQAQSSAATAPTAAAPPANATSPASTNSTATTAAPPAPSTNSASAATTSTLVLSQEIQQLASQGLNANQIAANLNVSLSTVQLYLPSAQAPAPNTTAQPAAANASSTTKTTL
jgi:DNA-binding NarL/FixJ family response regulator